jgi:y4mF family transcriptional regulator
MTPIGYMSEVGKLVRKRRKALGVTQAIVAQLAGVSRKAVSEIERGKPTVRVDVLTRVLEAVGLQWDVS